MKSLPTAMNIAHSAATQAISCHLSHTLPKSFCPCPHISSSPLSHSHFYRPTPNHPHFYTPNVQTTSICHVSLHQPHSEHLEDCTNPHCVVCPSVTLHTSISPSNAKTCIITLLELELPLNFHVWTMNILKVLRWWRNTRRSCSFEGNLLPHQYSFFLAY